MRERGMSERTEDEAGEIGSGECWGIVVVKKEGARCIDCSEEAALSPADIAEGSFYSARDGKTSAQHFISLVNRTIIISKGLYDKKFIGELYEDLE